MGQVHRDVALAEELRTAIRLLKCGLCELNRLDGVNDFFHLPILLLSSGLERLLKTILCCHHVRKHCRFPCHGVWPERRRGHDLVHLLDLTTNACFSDDYVSSRQATEEDSLFLRSDEGLHRILQVLSDFGQSARYYNLDVVLGEEDPGLSPDQQWERLETEVLKDRPEWEEELADPTKGDEVFKRVNRELTARCERLIRSLCHLFTIGNLGPLARTLSPITFDFLFLTDDHLGQSDYMDVKM